MAKNPRVRRFIRRYYRALALVLALVVAAGLTASVAPPAQAAPIPLVVTVDPGGTAYNPSDMAQIIQQVLNESPDVSDAIKRLVTENTLPDYSASTSGWGNGFQGTITATSDDTGLTFTVGAAQAPQSPSDPYWKTYFTGIVSSMLGMIGRAECMTFLKSRVPGATDQESKILKATCSALGSILASFWTGLITAIWAGQAPDLTTLATDVGKAIATAFFGSVLWDLDTYNWLTNSVMNPAIAYVGTLAVQTTWPWIQAPYAKLAALVGNWRNPAGAVQAVVLAYRQTVSASTLPCDNYDASGAPCADAYSPTRALYSTYNGPLYQVTRASDGTTRDIYPLSPGGDVDAAAQDSFCFGTTCTITKVYDESPDWDDLTVSQGGGASPSPDHPVYAAALPIQVGGTNEAYGMDFTGAMGYRDNTAQNTATDGEQEGMYMVASGTNVNNGCCFDFGNAETSSDDKGAGHMDAVNLSTTCFFESVAPCTGSGPWVQADLENGLYNGGNGSNAANTGNNSNFVTAVLNNDGQANYELEGGNAQSGGLTTYWNGGLPTNAPSGQSYIPMSQEGAVILGTGGDNSDGDVGSFFEGAMTIGYPSASADFYLQQNIVQAGYKGDSGGSGTTGSNFAPSAAGPAVVHSAGATGAGASGFSSVYTVDSANGHLQETYLPYMGDNWTTQDLSGTGGSLPGTPPVMAGTQPVSIVHCGYTSVYTVDAGSGDLQETYLPAIGGPWTTQNLSQKYGTPPTHVTPTAVVHTAGATGAAAACGFTSVYTVDTGSLNLQETYLPYIGDNWTTQDLSSTGGAGLPGTPPVQPGTSPVAVVHCGFTSVYTVDQSHQLQETFLPAIGDSWYTQSLPAPDTTTTPTAVVHTTGATGSAAACGFTSVYTVDQGSDDLQETYLTLIGVPWITQNLSATGGAGLPGTPPVAPGTTPVALVHLGFTSVYTVDEGSDHLQETYLPAVGGPWTTQDLSNNYKTPPTAETPIVLLHPDATGAMDWTSVYTIDEFNNDLQETYLSNVGFPGDNWVTQDLSGKYSTPPVAVSGTAATSWSVAHTGFTSVYTVDSDGDLQETYLPYMGDGWTTQDLSGTGGAGLPGTPKVLPGTAPVTVVHDGYTCVFTIDAGDSTHAKGDLQQTYLPYIGSRWYTWDLSTALSVPASKVTPAVVYHDGNTSVYTVDGSNGNLWETYQTGVATNYWTSQNLSANYHTPPVDAFTSPTAVYHDGYTSVYTVDTTNAADGSTLGDLQETYLPNIGVGWNTQNLSVKYQVPLVNILTSPTVVVHNSYVSIFTVDNASIVSSGDLQETYLPAIGDAWQTQDLSTNGTGTPPVEAGMQPQAIYHTGYTSVYTVDGLKSDGGDVQETYLPAISGSWASQDLTQKYQTPTTNQAPTALVHYDTRGGLTWTSVYSVDHSGNLWETYLPAIGDSWTAQNLSGNYQTPSVAIQQPVTGG